MTREIALTRGKVAIIDDEDADLIAPYRWSFLGRKDGRDGYAVASKRDDTGVERFVSMHRIILGAKPGEMCDHANGDGLDNRRANIRLCTPSQNAQNRRLNRAIRGVIKYQDAFSMMIYGDGGGYRRDGYRTQDEAARAYDAASRVLHADFGRPNFPDCKPPQLTGPLYFLGRGHPHPDLQHLIAPRPCDLQRMRCKVAVAERAAELARAALEQLECIAHNAAIATSLPPTHAEMMRMRVDGKTLADVGEQFGITRERVRQIEARCRSLGVRIPGAKPLGEAASRYLYHPPLKRGRPCKVRADMARAA